MAVVGHRHHDTHERCLFLPDRALDLGAPAEDAVRQLPVELRQRALARLRLQQLLELQVLVVVSHQLHDRRQVSTWRARALIRVEGAALYPPASSAFTRLCKVAQICHDDFSVCFVLLFLDGKLLKLRGTT
jgi:hypothetical protein